MFSKWEGGGGKEEIGICWFCYTCWPQIYSQLAKFWTLHLSVNCVSLNLFEVDGINKKINWNPIPTNNNGDGISIKNMNQGLGKYTSWEVDGISKKINWNPIPTNNNGDGISIKNMNPGLGKYTSWDKGFGLWAVHLPVQRIDF